MADQVATAVISGLATCTATATEGPIADCAIVAGSSFSASAMEEHFVTCVIQGGTYFGVGIGIIRSPFVPTPPTNGLPVVRANPQQPQPPPHSTIQQKPAASPTSGLGVSVKR